MKKSILLMLAMILTSGCSFAGDNEFYAAMKSCASYSDGSAAIREVSPGTCNIFSKTDEQTTLCTMPTSMARKLSIFKTTENLNEAQIEDMQKLELKYCRTK